MSKLNCFKNTSLEKSFNDLSANEQFQENAAVKTIELEYNSILQELNSIREELGLPLEESSLITSELRFDMVSPKNIQLGVISVSEAENITKYLTKKYGIESVMVDMGLFSAYGEFNRNNLKININKQTTLNKRGELTAATEPTGFVSRGTIFHEYLHPFVEVLEKQNKELYNEIYNAALEENNKSNFTDVSNYPEFKQKEELVVRYLERLSSEDKVPNLLERFLSWISDFFHKQRKTDKSTLKNLSKNTTVEELYDVFKNYGNLRQDIQDVINEDNQESRIQFLNSIINNLEIPQNVRDNFKQELDNLLDGRRFQIIGEVGASRIQEYNDLLNQAKELETQGKDYSQTGWYKGVDGWKYLSKEAIENFKIINKEENKLLTLKDVIGDENILFEIYPEIQDLSVVFLNKNAENYEKFKSLGEDERGEFNSDDKSIRINTNHKTNRGNIQGLQFTLGHEVAHQIQRIENFSRGGNGTTILNEALSILNIENTGKLGFLYAQISKSDKSNLTENQTKIVNDSIKTINALLTRNVDVIKDQYKRLMGEIDANIVGDLVSKNRATGTYSDLLALYLEGNNIDPNSIYFISGGEVQFSLTQQPQQKITEPNLSFETPSGESFNDYQQAIQSLDEGKIKLNIEDITVAEVDSDTNVDTFNGVINHLVKQGGLTGKRILDVNGDIIYVTKGETEGAKHIASELVEKQAVKLLGQSGVKMTKGGDFIFTDTLNKININGEEFNKKEIDALNYDELINKFNKETALEIEFSREYSKAIQPTQTKKRLEDISDIKTEDELTSSIKSLLNKLGIKITSIEDYIKHNSLKNNDVAPESNALMDLVNKVMAFRDGTITRDDLIEETMHLIEATIDPTTTEVIRRNIDKTPEWKEFSAHYKTIYSKEYSGDKLDEMVRREILGKVMANAVKNNFALEQDATLTQRSIFDRIRELLQQFFDRVEAFFKPEYQQQIERLNDDIYTKLMSGTLINEMNLDQNYGTKFRLYSTSNNMNNDVVRLQKQAEKALEVLRNNISNLEGKDPSQSQMLKSANDLLKKVGEKVKDNNEIEARVEAIATFSKVLNMVQKQTRYLERAVKKSTQNKHPFSAEEMIVYNNLVNEFGKTILPTVKNIVGKYGENATPSEKRILEGVKKAESNISDLIGQVENSGFNAKEYVVDLLVNRLGLDKETENFLRERADSQQNEANWFFMQFGNLSHSSNVYLNALGHVITKTDFDKRQGFQQDIKPFIDRLSKSGYLKGKGLSSLADGKYIQSAHNFTEIEKAENTKKHELFYSLILRRLNDPKITAEDKKQVENILSNKVSVEEFSNIDVIDNLGTELSAEYEKQLDLWQLQNYKLSPLNSEIMVERREKLKAYSQTTQDYERTSSASYSAIMQNAEIVDGVPLVTEDMRYDLEELKKLRIYDKSIYDQDGNLRKGISLAQEGDADAIKIADNLYVVLDENADKDTVTAVELNQIDNARIEENLEKFKNRTGLSDSFKNMLSGLEDSEAYDFLMLNSYVGYTDEYYETLQRPGIVDRLEEAKQDIEDEADIDILIEDIVSTTKKVNTILRANRMLNNPSETNFDRMDFYEVNSVKEYAQKLEYLYSEARRYLPKQVQEEVEQETVSETIVNKAFVNYVKDTTKVAVLDYSDKTTLTRDEKQNIDRIFEVIETNTTQNKREEIVSLRKAVKGFSQGRLNKLSNVQKRAFKLSEQEYAEMSEEETFAYMTNELLRYSYTKLHPYFRKSQPIGVERALFDLETGTLSSTDFIQNYENGDYPYLKISPNYNFQEVTEDNNRNPHFQNAKINGTPMYRIFEAGTTLEDVTTKSIDQLKAEGKLNKYANVSFLKEYGVDMVELFNTGKETAKNNVNKFEARQALLDLQKTSLEKNGVLGKHNLYLLPQKEASKTRKFDEFLQSGKELKTVFEEMFTFREDEAELGQDAGKAKSIRTDGSYTVPKFGLRRLKEAPVTTDLLESYTWMNYKANEYAARKLNIGDAIAVNQALMNAEFEGNIDVKTSNAYKTFKESYDFNFYGVKEVWSRQFKVLGMTFDWAKMLKNFGWLIRLRNLGFTVISPITSALTGSVFLRIESLVGEIVDKDALPIVNKYFAKYAGDASREMLSLESKSMLNSLGELWGWYDPMERYDNTMYSKALRGLQKSPFAAHQLANFPVNTRVGLAVLANSKFVEGEMLEYRQYKSRSKGKSDKELRREWANYTSVLDVTNLEEDGRITYDYDRIATALNNNFTEEETRKFMEDKSILIRGRIKSAIQNVDGQISTEDKSMSTRNAFFAFMNIHRSWLMIAAQNKLKRKQINLSTGYKEQGSYLAVIDLFGDVIKDAQRSGVINALENIRKNWKDYDEVTKNAVSRTLWEWGLLNVLVGLTVLAMNELGDDDEDSLLFQQGSMFLFRTTNEVASSTVSLPRNLYDTLENVIVGLNTVEIATQFPDVFSSEIVERGRYKGVSERERYFYRHMLMMRDYNNLFRDVEGSIKSYNYFNFVRGKSLDYLTLYPFLKSEEK
jgi:hypothetical protein